jgi:exodeoxyribonuclease V alpha subunit
MTDVIVDNIVSKRDFGTIFAGRLADGSSVQVKATNASMLGQPSVGELWSVDGDLSETQWGPQISARRAVRALPSGQLMVDYLAGCVAGIGPARAHRLWQRFEDRPVLGPRLAAALVAAWKAMAREARLLRLLKEAGHRDPDSHPHRLVGAADAVVKDLVGSGSTAIARDEFRERIAGKLAMPPSSQALDRAVQLAIERQAVIVSPSGLLASAGMRPDGGCDHR